MPLLDPTMLRNHKSIHEGQGIVFSSYLYNARPSDYFYIITHEEFFPVVITGLPVLEICLLIWSFLNSSKEFDLGAS